MTQNDAAAKPKGPAKKLILVRFGKMGSLGWFEHNEAHVPKVHSHAVIKTSRGLELGEVVGSHSYKGGQFRFTPEQTEGYFGPTEAGVPVVAETGSFVRFANAEDLSEQKHLEVSAAEEAKCCQRLANEMGLAMKIVDAEHLFGGERVVVYFISEGRIDFRELVKRMAKEYQTRIELRQIGSRDEARIVSDFETCGQECCCKRYLKVLAPVNMRMAKLQKATLDPSKISGHCGRLKCCLRYEDATYQELRGTLPRKGLFVETSQGVGRVFDVQILTQLVVVQFDNGDRQAWPVSEIHILENQPQPGEEVDMAALSRRIKPQPPEAPARPAPESYRRQEPSHRQEKPPQDDQQADEPSENTDADLPQSANTEKASQPPQQNRQDGQQRGDSDNRKNRNRRRFKKKRPNGQNNNSGQGDNRPRRDNPPSADSRNG